MERLALLNTHARPDTPEATENRKRLMALAQKDFPEVIRTLIPKLLHEEHLSDAAVEFGLDLLIGGLQSTVAARGNAHPPRSS